MPQGSPKFINKRYIDRQTDKQTDSYIDSVGMGERGRGVCTCVWDLERRGREGGERERERESEEGPRSLSLSFSFCLTTPGVRKDIQRHARHLYSQGFV